MDSQSLPTYNTPKLNIETPALQPQVNDNAVHQSKRAPWLFLMIVLILAMIAGIGFLVFQNVQLQQQIKTLQSSNENVKEETIQLSPNPDQTLNNIDTEEWQVYENTDLEIPFSFKYPKNFYLLTKFTPDEQGLDSIVDIFFATSAEELSLIESCISQQECSQYPLRISVHQIYANNRTFDEFLESKSWNKTEMQPLTFGNFQGYQSTFEGIGVGKNIYVQNPEQRRIIMYIQTNAVENFAENNIIGDQILSTFEFTK